MSLTVPTNALQEYVTFQLHPLNRLFLSRFIIIIIIIIMTDLVCVCEYELSPQGQQSCFLPPFQTFGIPGSSYPDKDVTFVTLLFP